MKIINPAVLRDLEAGIGLRLDMGCGRKPRPGFYGVDQLELPEVSIVSDLNKPLSGLPDDSVVEIRTRHTLEHVTEFLPLMKEFHRITRSGGRIEIVVPHFSNPYGYSDPTHVRFFGLYSFFYFAHEANQPRRKVPSFYLLERFAVEQVRIKLLKGSLFNKLVNRPLTWFINSRLSRQDWYERSLCRWIPAESIGYVLQPKKGIPVTGVESAPNLAKAG